MIKMKDYHMHTTYSDGKDTIDEMVGTAARLGFSEVAITDHIDWLFVELIRSQGIKHFTFMPEEIEQYKRECKEAEQKHQLRVLAGLEIGYFNSGQDDLRSFIEKAALDIILLSVHRLESKEEWTRPDGRVEKKGYELWLGGESLKELSRQYEGVGNLYEAYFDKLNKFLNSGFNSLAEKVGVAHLNVFSIYEGGKHPNLTPSMMLAVEEVAEKKLMLELNMHYDEVRPPLEVAKHYLDAGGKQVYPATDSHSVRELEQAAGRYKIFADNFGDD